MILSLFSIAPAHVDESLEPGDADWYFVRVKLEIFKMSKIPDNLVMIRVLKPQNEHVGYAMLGEEIG